MFIVCHFSDWNPLGTLLLPLPLSDLFLLTEGVFFSLVQQSLHVGIEKLPIPFVDVPLSPSLLVQNIPNTDPIQPVASLALIAIH